jgi:hypothetical protein
MIRMFYRPIEKVELDHPHEPLTATAAAELSH